MTKDQESKLKIAEWLYLIKCELLIRDIDRFDLSEDARQDLNVILVNLGFNNVDIETGLL